MTKKKELKETTVVYIVGEVGFRVQFVRQRPY